jgi:hypothetical protein
MTDSRPGLDPRRLVALMRAAIDRMELDLSDRVLITEAATGAYAVTSVMAALAGARQVHAIVGDNRHGTAADAVAITRALVDAAGLTNGIRFVTDKRDAPFGEADIVTNSGHVRPLDGPAIARMKAGTAISLMYETWELRPGEVDLDACRHHGVRVAGVNERHPAVDVFSFLGPMAVRQLTDAGVAPYSANVLLLCDNPFRPYLERGLAAAGAVVEVRDRVTGAAENGYDAVLVALQPRSEPVLAGADVVALAECSQGAVLVQFWGDVDRPALHAAGVPVWPPVAPPQGHMGILPSAVGPEPIVRLQGGGLKVGELLCRGAGSLRPDDLDYVQPV